MTRYETRQRSRPGSSSVRGVSKALRQMTVMLIVFTSGYLFSTVYDAAHLRDLIHKVVFVEQETPTLKENPKTAALPKPKFEFYTLLAEGAPVPKASEAVSRAPDVQSTQAVIRQNVASASSALLAQNVAASRNMPTAQNVPAVQSIPVAQNAPGAQNLSVAHSVSVESGVSHEMYLLQLASFPRQADAQKMRKSLMMKGFNVSVTQVTQQGNHWFRVVVGPFASKTDAERVQGSLARSERMFGMIRKMNI
ncbi:MAG: SPOR domain-containing protein [Legionellaceae bacterium]